MQPHLQRGVVVSHPHEQVEHERDELIGATGSGELAELDANVFEVSTLLLPSHATSV